MQTNIENWHGCHSKKLKKCQKFRFALDLYKNKLLDVELPFTNPFRFTTTLGYNPRLQVNIM